MTGDQIHHKLCCISVAERIIGKKFNSHENTFVLPKTEVKWFQLKAFPNKYFRIERKLFSIKTAIKFKSKMAYGEGHLGNNITY